MFAIIYIIILYTKYIFFQIFLLTLSYLFYEPILGLFSGAFRIVPSIPTYLNHTFVLITGIKI